MKRNALLLVALFFVLAGCATAAQQKAFEIRTNLQELLKRTAACVQNIRDNPVYQPLFAHMPKTDIGILNPSLAQLTDNGLPTEEEAKLLVASHKELTACRQRMIEDSMKAVPSTVPLLLQQFNQADSLTVDLLQRKITYGEANRKSSALANDFIARYQGALAELDRELQASHQAELAHRQAAGQALLQWSAQQQALQQNQQLINTINRPVMTNCTRMGNTVNCTSY